MDVFSSDPAKVAQWIQGAVNALLVMLVALNWIRLDDLQMAAVMGFANVVAGAFGAWLVKRNTTPLAAPVTKEGTPLVPAQPDKPITRGLT